MDEKDLTPEQLEALEEEMARQEEEASEQSEEDQFAITPEMYEAYGAPPEYEVQNKDSFLHKAGFKIGDTTRTTFLDKEELGRPMFTVRFLMDLHDLAKYYLDPIVIEINEMNKSNPEMKVKNDVAQYIWEKIQNVTSSGMSNEGFLTNLTASRKLEIERKKYPNRIENLQGGKKKR